MPNNETFFELKLETPSEVLFKITQARKLIDMELDQVETMSDVCSLTVKKHRKSKIISTSYKLAQS